MTCGIYWIRNKTSGKKYVGSSVNIEKRWSSHKRDLRKGIHANSKLQRSFNKYGLEDFEFYIVKTCEREWLAFSEQILIVCTDSVQSGYNICPSAYSPNIGSRKLGAETKDKLSKANSGKRISEDQRKAISEKLKGRVRSEESKLKQSNSTKGKPKPDSMRENLKKAWDIRRNNKIKEINNE